MAITDRFKKLFASPDDVTSIRSGLGKSRSGMTREIGEAGTENFHGFITQDYNAKFNGDSAIDIYEEMRRSDATVNAVLTALKLPILQTEVSVESADADDEKENEKAEFVRKNLFEQLDGGFKQHLREALNHLDFGFYYFEKVYAIKEGKIVLKKLAPRMPSAHYRWNMTSAPDVPGITQLLPSPQSGSDTMREIPMSKLVLYTNNKEGDNYSGISVLRSAYKHWYFKDLLYKIDGVKHERGAGILVVGLPAGSTAQDKTDAEDLGKNFKVNEQAYIVKPSTEWTVELLTSGIESQSSALMESVKHHDREITTNILAQFLDLGSGSTGSFALSKDQTDFFTLSLRAITDYIEEIINEFIIKELVRLNWGEQEKYPRLRFQDVGQVDFDEMSTTIERLTNAGLVKNDPQLKVWIHKTFGLPEVTIEDFEDEEPALQKVDNKKKEVDNTEDEIEAAELATRKYFRKLTFAEERVELAEVEEFFDDEEARLQAELDKISEEQKVNIMRQAERLINSGDIAAIATLTLPAIAGLRKAMQEAAKAAIERGKATSAKEVATSIPTTSGASKKILNTKVDLMIAERAHNVEQAVKTALLTAIGNEIGKKPALSAVGEALDKFISQSNQQITGKLIVEFFNEGRDLSFGKAKESIHGLQWSAILDKKTCNMCMSLDGRVFNINDSFTNINQVHTHCRCILVAILKTDEDLPPIKQLPKTIRNRFETIEGVPTANDFTQLKKPIIRKGSRLEQRIKDGAVEVE